MIPKRDKFLNIKPKQYSLGIIVRSGYITVPEIDPHAWLYGDSSVMAFGDTQEIIYGS